MEYRNAKYIDDTKLIIDCEINHEKFGWIPYTLNMNEQDNTIDNNSLYEKMTQTQDIEPYVPPSQEEKDTQTSNANRFKRDSLLENEVDPLVSNPLRWNDFTEEQKQAITKYRRELLDITLHSNWPNLKDEDWPTLSL